MLVKSAKPFICEEKWLNLNPKKNNNNKKIKKNNGGIKVAFILIL